MDWLNSITDDGFNFFGIEIELWKIGDSPIAPKFNIVSKPNDWSKTVKQAKSAGSGELTETKKMQLEYWTSFKQFMDEEKSKVKCHKPLPQHWMTHSITNRCVLNSSLLSRSLVSENTRPEQMCSCFYFLPGCGRCRGKASACRQSMTYVQLRS